MPAAPSQERSVDLVIGGMTCASCAARVEKKLNRLDGVTATVNYATEKAHVVAPSAVSDQDLVDRVGETGYTASVATRVRRPAADETGALRRRLLVSLVLTVPVVAMAMVSALQVDYWQWISLVLATPVVLWGGWPFHRAAWTNLRHRATTMDTLISVGTLAAYGWSLYALLFGTAGEIGMRHAFELTVQRGEGSSYVYFEAAAGVTTFILAGRYLESRSKRQAGAALRALLELGAKSVSVLQPDGREVRLPVEDLAVGMRFVVRPGEKVATDGVVESGRSAVDAALVTGESVPAEVGAGRPGRRLDGQHQRAAGRARDPGRRRHPAGPDGPPRRGRPERQGRRPAPRRPGVRGVRAGGHRAGVGRARGVGAPGLWGGRRRSPPPSPSSSSPAPAPSAWPRPRR